MYLSFVKESPIKLLILIFKKIFYFWWRNPFENGLLDKYQSMYAIIFLMSFYCILNSKFKNKFLIFFLIIFLFFTLVYSLTGVYFNWKYRYPIEPLMIVLASYGFQQLIISAVRRRWRSSIRNKMGIAN